MAFLMFGPGIVILDMNISPRQEILDIESVFDVKKAPHLEPRGQTVGKTNILNLKHAFFIISRRHAKQ